MAVFSCSFLAKKTKKRCRRNAAAKHLAVQALQWQTSHEMSKLTFFRQVLNINSALAPISARYGRHISDDRSSFILRPKSPSMSTLIRKFCHHSWLHPVRRIHLLTTSPAMRTVPGSLQWAYWLYLIVEANDSRKRTGDKGK